MQVTKAFEHFLSLEKSTNNMKKVTFIVNLVNLFCFNNEDVLKVFFEKFCDIYRFQ